MRDAIRIVLKISGDLLRYKESPFILDRAAISRVIEQIVYLRAAYPQPVQVAVMVGGGNILRGSRLSQELDFRTSAKQCAADDLGMLATYINGGALYEVMEQIGKFTPRLMVSLPFGEIGEPFYRKKAISHLNKGYVVILAGGTGRPRCTTDYAAVLRACELDAHLVLKGTKVPGIFTSDPLDPETGENAVHLPRLSYDEFLEYRPPLRIMDTTAVTLAKENGMRIRVFEVGTRPEHLYDAVMSSGQFSEIGPALSKKGLTPPFQNTGIIPIGLPKSAEPGSYEGGSAHDSDIWKD